MGKLSVKYPFCAIHTADWTVKSRLIADCPLMSMIVSEKVHRLDPPVAISLM